MENVATKMMREYVNSQKFRSTGEIMEAMRDLFRDALQQVMEGALEEELGYEKSERKSERGESGLSKNYRNGYSKKSVKTQLGKIDVNIPRTVTENMNQKLLPNMIETQMGWTKKSSGYTPVA